MTKTLGMLQTELLFKVLSESTWFMGVWVIRDDRGVGDVPGVRGGSGGVCRFCALELN